MHDKATKFLNDINTLEESVIPSSEKFSDYSQIVGQLAKNGANYQVDQQKIDSLRDYYNSFMQSIDEAIVQLSKLKEFDTSFNILKPSISHMEIVKDSYVSTTPANLFVYKIGWTKANDSLKNIINEESKTFSNRLMLASRQREIKESETKKFMTKYKLSY